ncbi:AbrB/MazE/SpoVT family DNA-binding domain-containing protein [Alcanivorax sp. 24]|uniref:AbrB/MazE/SpoVT family DNA-binding domain-containing protein n=1 Tax=Alcanivorax sp. 24 TaxID=2545266 RepID=UPI00105ED7C6|nr:AbrB/MazE/SpoVT family DNA-binding domain-containing protein [Alcanivorax sp. 24]
MPVTKTISRWGNAQALRIPSAILQQLGLHESSQVSLSVEGGKLVITPIKPEAESLDALLDGTSPEQFRVEEDEVWLDAEPVGREIL